MNADRMQRLYCLRLARAIYSEDYLSLQGDKKENVDQLAYTAAAAADGKERIDSMLAEIKKLGGTNDTAELG